MIFVPVALISVKRIGEGGNICSLSGFFFFERLSLVFSLSPYLLLMLEVGVDLTITMKL